ncbi:hypothetical protein FACS1894219_05920 [Clostridia bacterium]|nr:hypothetical protein FACS1894219_05920 [Clostridia bacterium]
MSKVQLTVTMDEKLVNALEKACYNSGMEIDLAFTMFAQTVRKKKCIPDEVITDPFYSKKNLAKLRKSIAQLEAGKGKVHELIEADND